MALVGIVTALAMTDLAEMIGRYRLNSATKELAARVTDTRMKAITDNRECALQFVTSDSDLEGAWRANAGRYEQKCVEITADGPMWVGTYDGLVDLNAGPNAQPGVSIEPWSELVGPTSPALPQAIAFSGQGFTTNPDQDFTGGVVRIILRNKRATQTERRVVRIDRGGNVQIAVP